jgi:small subunit ribosomal protein S1
MAEERPWERPLSEGYWQALLQQGEAGPATTEREPLGSPASPDDRGGWPGAPASGWAAAEAARTGLGQGPGAAAEPSGASRCDEDWARLQRWAAEGRTFRAPVIGCNKGGLLVRVCEGIGFVPASQLADLPCSLGTPELRADLEAMVGRDLTLRVIELDPSRSRVICSERATLWDDAEVERRLALLEAHIGSEAEGTVRSVCDFGAFVDFGGIDGLIHVSELSWQRVSHPSDVLVVGDRVQVVVLNVDREARRVGLSLKRCQADPWAVVAGRYQVGDVIDAVVTNVVHFGAFARVNEGVEGLIHISELADGPFLHPCHVVSEGQVVRARVLHIDAGARRLGLSIRQA